jgi:D-amino-acid dehydrogenase
MSKHIVIIGGGIIGLTSAYYLAKDGHQITLIDKNHPVDNLNCSIGNMGMIVPSHFVPLASPGIISQGLKWMLNPRSPFYIKPKINKDLIFWLLKFWKSANEAHVKNTSPGIKEYNSLSLDLYEQISADDLFKFFFRKDGLLLLCKTEKNLEEEIHLTKTANALGLTTAVLNSADLKTLEPNITIDVSGGVLYPGDAHLSPHDFINGLYQYLKSNDRVEFVCNNAVKQIEKKSNQITAILTQSGKKITGDEFILAAGSFSGNLAKLLSLKLPMLSGKGYSLTLNQQKEKLKTPSILCEARVAVTPWDNLIRFGGTMELGGEEYITNPLRIEGIIQSIKKYFPKYDTAPLTKVEPWSGLRPCPPDGLPYLGRFKKYTNLIAATGHSMMGLSLAPATGKLVSNIVNEEKTAIDILQFNPDRF